MGTVSLAIVDWRKHLPRKPLWLHGLLKYGTMVDGERGLSDESKDIVRYQDEEGGGKEQ